VNGDYFFCFDKTDYIRERRAGRDGLECLLCRILRGASGVSDLTVYRDDLFSASLNLYPYNPGHLFLYPVRHLEDVRALTEEEAGRQAKLVGYFLDRLEDVYHPAGFNIGYNMGRSAGASLPHLHQHIIPRYQNEIGLAEIVAGTRVLVEDPRRSLERLKEAVYKRPFSISMT
jgi:ATP adenylyltransferase